MVSTKALLLLLWCTLLFTSLPSVCEATPVAPLCPTRENGGLSKIALMIACKNDSDRYSCMQQNDLCVPEGGLLQYAQCPDQLAVHYVALYPTTSCASVLQDEAFCKLPLGAALQGFCNDSDCPIGVNEFAKLFGTLAQCGYLSGIGGAAIDTESERVQCIKDKGGCAPSSPDTLINYSNCATKVSRLLLEGASAINSTLVTSEADCTLRLGRPDDTESEAEDVRKICSSSFGDLVGTRYCPASWWDQDFGGIPAGPLVVGSSVLGVVAVGAVLMRYRRQSFRNYDSYSFGGKGTAPNFQKVQRSNFSTLSTYNNMSPTYMKPGGGSFGYPEATPIASPSPRESLFSRLKNRGNEGSGTGRMTGMGFSNYLNQNGFSGSRSRSAPPPLPPRDDRGPLQPPPGLGHNKVKTRRIGRPTESMMR